MPRPLDQSKIDRLKELKKQGLSNRQISIELCLSPVTVRRYLGSQQLMSRSEYGSIVSHITGDSFVKGMDGMAKKIENPGLSVSTVYVKGKELEYRVDLEKGIHICRKDLEKGIHIYRNNVDQLYLPKDQLSDFVKEIVWLTDCFSQDKLPL